MVENKDLEDGNHELKAAMTRRGDRNEGGENGASMEITASKAEVNDMRQELDNLHER